MEEKLANLKLDLEELNLLVQSAKRQNTKILLLNQAQSLAKEIAQLEKIKKVDKTSEQPTAPKRYIAELTNYAWDQSDKFVKIFVTVNGLSPDTPDQRLDCNFTDKSLNLTIHNATPDRDYSFIVKNLLDLIDCEKSYAKIKSDCVAIYMKKVNEGKQWSHLTLTEKNLKNIKDSAFKDDLSDSSDPSASLMNMMKRLYETGDGETKRLIAKSWQESEEKRRRGEM